MNKEKLLTLRKYFSYFVENIFYNKYSAFLIFLIILLNYCYLGSFWFFKPFIQNFFVYLPLIIYLLNFKYSKFTFALFLYFLFGIVSSVLGENTTIENMSTYLPIFSLILYLEGGIRCNCKNILTSLLAALGLLVVINFITLIVFPKGLYYDGMYYENWFLTYKNAHIMHFIPLIVISYICTYYQQPAYRFFFFVITGIITFSVFYCFSANSVFAYLLLIIFIIFQKYLVNIKILNSKTYFIVYLLLFFIIVIFRQQSLFSFLIVNIFNKNLTLNNRTQLWDLVIEEIKNKPIFGHGVESGKQFSVVFNNKHYTHAHNTILDVAYKGGFIWLICFFNIFRLTFKELEQSNHFISKLINFAIFCILIMSIFEAREDRIGLYLLLVIGYNINFIINSFTPNKTNVH